MVRKISGKQSSGKIHPLQVDSNEVSDIPCIANTLADTSNNSSSEQYSAKFQSFLSQI